MLGALLANDNSRDDCIEFLELIQGGNLALENGTDLRLWECQPDDEENTPGRKKKDVSPETLKRWQRFDEWQEEQKEYERLKARGLLPEEEFLPKNVIKLPTIAPGTIVDKVGDKEAQSLDLIQISEQQDDIEALIIILANID